MIGAAAGLVCAFGILGWIALYQISRPLAFMTGEMTKLANGDLNIEIEGADRADEVGGLARSLQVFKENAVTARRLEEEQRQQQVQKESRQHAVEGYIAVFDRQVSEALDTLSAASTEMHSTAASMSSTAEETSRQATAVTTASDQTSANVQTVAAATEQLHASTNEISRQVTQSAEFASTAVVEADRTNATIQGLAETAQKIGEVVSADSNIASQTNLLALNATIEAARAGEAGRGFAVVASEVKALANQTAKATEDISTQIAAIQGETGLAVDAIKAIGGTIRQMNQIATAIAAAVEQQGAATRDISTTSNWSRRAPVAWQPISARGEPKRPRKPAPRPARYSPPPTISAVRRTNCGPTSTVSSTRSARQKLAARWTIFPCQLVLAQWLRCRCARKPHTASPSTCAVVRISNVPPNTVRRVPARACKPDAHECARETPSPWGGPARARRAPRRLRAESSSGCRRR